MARVPQPGRNRNSRGGFRPDPERYYARMGGLYVVLALAALVVSFFGAPAPSVAWMFAGLWLLMGSWYLLSRVALRRRARRGTQATRNPGGPSRAGGREARP